jgi:hypothetical protein
MANVTKCPKCGSEMQDGFLIESKLPVRWLAGKPETSVLGGTKAHGIEQRQVESQRCITCGYLELSARTLVE